MPQSPSPTPLPPPPADPLAPYDLSPLCDGRRTDFPLGMLVETVKVMLNGVYLEQDLDFLLAHKNGQSKVELRRPPKAGDSLVVLRVPARQPPRSQKGAAAVDHDLPDYEVLPRAVRDNLSPDQWREARREVVRSGTKIPETARYINLKNGLSFEYTAGQVANGPLLPVADLAGGRGKDDTQFHTAPRGAHFPEV
ncbi:MAG TPA: hypothetical protein VGQ62_09690 [Chloroflexota bacterium]|jgi:hypothetical protein|nr:hypothetical protein [Chloroflexota bacterium]